MVYKYFISFEPQIQSGYNILSYVVYSCNFCRFREANSCRETRFTRRARRGHPPRTIVADLLVHPACRPRFVHGKQRSCILQRSISTIYEKRLTKSRLGQCFWVLTVLSSLNLVVFILLALHYKYQNREEPARDEAAVDT